MQSSLWRFGGGFFLALCAIGPAAAAPMQWDNVRDGTLRLRPQGDAPRLHVRWQPAWQSEANAEQLYLLDGRGRLAAQLDIPASQPRGQRELALAGRSGDYQLSVPGYSFRRFSVRHDDGHIASLLEPVKLHFSADWPRPQMLYFQVRAGEQAVLAGKHHGGVSALRATRLDDGRSAYLPLQQHGNYSHYDQMALPAAARDTVWQLELEGSGKAAFWLDGTDNLFAQQINHLYRPVQQAGHVHLRLAKDTRGTTPRLGVALPYVEPPAASYPLLDALGVRAANYYSFVDSIARNPLRETGFRRLYLERFGIDQDITLLAASGRRAVLPPEPLVFAGLHAWLDDRLRLRLAGLGGLHYLAFADEPNLNYPDYASFERYFEAMLKQLHSVPYARDLGVRVALPASSRWLGGPFHEQGGERRGIDWAQRLLKRYGNAIDALAWHEWMVRDLLATRRYRDSVQQAAKLVGLDAAGRPRKALLLGQTNISSGDSLSPYEKDTHFAALWWASVAINAAQDGLLDMLNWFHVVDEADYPKGMLRQRGDGALEPKPVALAQHFIQQHWLAHVQALDNDAFEVDALAMHDDDGAQRRLLGVNKAARVQQVTLDGAGALCRAGDARLQFFGPDNLARPARFSCTADGRVQFSLPGETLFALGWLD